MARAACAVPPPPLSGHSVAAGRSRCVYTQYGLVGGRGRTRAAAAAAVPLSTTAFLTNKLSDGPVYISEGRAPQRETEERQQRGRAMAERPPKIGHGFREVTCNSGLTE